MSPLRAHLILSAAYLASRALLHVAGLRYSFSLDWMWLADPADLRERLAETLLYFHAFPPGINALTGVLLKLGEPAPAAAHALFLALGVLLVNALLYLARALGLSTLTATGLALAFSLVPASIYFEHLFHYEWLVIAMLGLTAALFHHATATLTFGAWLAFFSVNALIGFTRSTFHAAWFVALVMLAAWVAGRGSRRHVLAAAAIPALLLLGLYAKNLVLFGEFGSSTFGPASLTLVTVHHLPPDERKAWIAERRLSPYAAISVYSPPRAYMRFFSTADHDGWPAQLTRLEHPSVGTANFNHWWLLDVHRTRRRDVMQYIRERPLGYVSNVLLGVRDVFRPTTTWHPRDDTEGSPHHQHRQILGGYERRFNRVVHGTLLQPVGPYVLLPLLLVWACTHAWPLVRDGDPAARARGALVLLCVFQITYVVAASSMLTFLESARYRFQIEWAIWLLTALFIAVVWRRHGVRGESNRIRD